MRISRGGFKVREHVIVRLHTADGLTGLGEGIGTAASIESVLSNYLAPRIIGLDVLAIESFRFRMFREPTYFENLGSVMSSVSAVEMALWDLQGKLLGVPCYQLLGGRFRDRIRAYASDVYWQESVSDLCAETTRIADLGYGCIKAHLGVMPPRQETIRVAALRKVLGDDIDLMIDLNCGYDIRQAREAIQRWEQFNLYWLEEPLLPDLGDALGSLRSISKIPIAAGENEFAASGFHKLGTQRAIDVAMPDVGRVGGITELKNIAAVARAHGIVVSPHNFSSGVLLAATAHAITSSADMDLIEVDTSGNAIYEETLNESWIIKDGFVTVPDDLGLGVTLRESTIEKYAQTKKVFE